MVTVGLDEGGAVEVDAGQAINAWTGPLALKGVLSPSDAQRAADAGVDAVIVSNHGGRQLDHVPATIDQLPHIVAALALGARAVLVGRAYLYGLAAAGEPGVRHAIDILCGELRTAMALSGARTVSAIRPDLVRTRALQCPQ